MECYMISLFVGVSGSDCRHVDKVYRKFLFHILNLLYSNIVGLVAQG
jgi:hypothetical protein